ncbi:MAG: TonB family protein [Acidobacteriota bacterium]|jgi:protein TonB|nr:TonB family protein [Acidobacteriota bacterium]
MFEGLNEIGKSDGGKTAASFGIAILVEALIVGAIILAPLIFFSVLPESELLTFLIAPPPPPSDAPPPRVAQVNPNQFVAPTEIPTEIPPPVVDDQPFIATGPVTSTLATAATVNTGVSNILQVATASGPVAPPPPPKPKAKPVRVGGNVQESRLIRRVQPVYPPMAQKARVQGEVILEVEVDEEGNVVDIIVKSGHPLLKQAAVDAVKQWKYSPTLLNGEPTPVTADVKVNFKLN